MDYLCILQMQLEGSSLGQFLHFIYSIVIYIYELFISYSMFYLFKDF
jgi:hypothetical protein